MSHQFSRIDWCHINLKKVYLVYLKYKWNTLANRQTHTHKHIYIYIYIYIYISKGFPLKSWLWCQNRHRSERVRTPVMLLIFLSNFLNIVYIYIYIYSSKDELIESQLFSLARNPRLTLRQSGILPQTIVCLCVYERIFYAYIFLHIVLSAFG